MYDLKIYKSISEIDQVAWDSIIKKDKNLIIITGYELTEEL